MKEENAKYTNYVRIDGEGEHPEIHCPVCGKQTVHTVDRCQHVLFVYEEETVDGVTFSYVHPKLKQTLKDLEERQPGRLSELETEHLSPAALKALEDEVAKNFPDPSNLASELNLNPESTCVFGVSNLFGHPGCEELVEFVVGIAFRPASEVLKAYRRTEVKGS